MENYEYLKGRVLEMNLDLIGAIIEQRAEDADIIRSMMSIYIDRMIWVKNSSI